MPRGRGTPVYNPYRYVPPHRVGFLRPFNLVCKRVYTFPILVWNRVWFSRESRSIRTYLSFQFQMSGKEREICELEMDLKNIFVFGLIKVLITKFLPKTRSKNGYGFQRSSLKTGVENYIVWSEIGSGFEEPGGTPPPRIPRSTPPPRDPM